jgi:hypothetical protein
VVSLNRYAAILSFFLCEIVKRGVIRWAYFVF